MNRTLAVLLVSGLAFLPVNVARADGGNVFGEIQRASAARKVKLADAIGTALKERPGSTFLEGGLAWRPHPAVYEVDVLEGDKATAVFVDCASGKVVTTEPLEIDEEELEEVVAAEHAAEHAKIGYADAILAAEKAPPGGHALWVMIETIGGRAVFSVIVLTSDQVLKIGIDAVDAKVVRAEPRRIAAGFWGFNTGTTGAPPAGWSFRETHPGKSPGSWSIAADLTPPSKPNVLGLITRNKGGTYNLALVEKTSFQDLDLEVRVKSNSGSEDQGGGLVWRCKDENNYYICRINPLESNFRVYKVVAGKRQQLDSVDMDLSAGRWYRLRATMQGDRIACYLNGLKRLEARDDSIKAAGKIGLWTKADASSSFDDLTVYTVFEKESTRLMSSVCEICKKNPATVHLTELMPSGEKWGRQLCQECAEKMGVAGKSPKNGGTGQKLDGPGQRPSDDAD